MDEIKTKAFRGVLKALDVDATKNLVVLPFKVAQYENTKMSGKNIKTTKVIIADNPGNSGEGKVNVDGLNVFDIINNDKVILTKDTVKKIEEVLG
jgi:large subunit ribosomal protein L4